MDGAEKNLERLGQDLAGGLAGVVLNLVHFAGATGDSGFWDAAVKGTELVAARLGDAHSVPEISGGQHPHAGLLRGSSGIALMFVRLYELSGDDGLLDLAATALRQDLRRCIVTADGSLAVNERWRTMPYLADGSAGIGMVLHEYLTHRYDERFAQAAARARRAAKSQFYAQSGLFYGRAGMLLCLSRGHWPGTAACDPDVATHVRRLRWHALTFRGQLAFPGDQLLRLSTDLATGSAGVLLALGSALHHGPVGLPFLKPFPNRRARGDSVDVSTDPDLTSTAHERR
jgi:lantibiotic modifying enzyme